MQHAELPINWRGLSLEKLRRWMRELGYARRMPRMQYRSKDEIIVWIEEHVEAPHCPTCGRPT